ncbi:cytochrome-c peroxidase [Flavobacterium covae]|uniref:cytochrome-c peroxidase n=1 Tax=Flavobacterium covae TaxID=2906076 RepID=UPI001FB83A39|nr:cytochrome c peroxidase [Flavobacterium covae]MCJ1807361.1 cytochrome-c peroxidase [Flavobacterium covae]
MKKQNCLYVLLILSVACQSNDDSYTQVPETNENYPNITSTFANTIDLKNLYNYANQIVPSYITKFNTGTNLITNKGATLGRVLFYDKNLSSNNTISCANCHQQANAFSDTELASKGVNGTTDRHSMRLINNRFTNETRFFWDKRASSLEFQVTQPIKNHTEMGFSGTNGDSNFNDLIMKLSTIPYYPELFKFVYGSEEITEEKIQLALAQFVKSIQSFDSKYDIGRALVSNDNQSFPNFNIEENTGKKLFLTSPIFDALGNRISGGLGCATCHTAPEFDLNPNSKNNGIGGSIKGGADFSVTRAPSLRDLVKTNGITNGSMMHTGVIKTLQAAIGHYGNLTNAATNDPNLDNRLKPNGFGQQLHLNANEVSAVIAFLKTLSGTNVYTDPKWSTPFKS